MNLFDLTGKTVLITGASSGLGERFAICLAKANARVILAARRTHLLKQIAEKLNNAIVLEMDVSDRSLVEQAFYSVEALGEKIDICINNAGIYEETPVFAEDDRESFETVFKTNVMGSWYVIQSVAKHMKNHKIPGSIINIASINGDLVPDKTGISYDSSKAAVLHMARSLVQELSPHNIRINTISPGFFLTPMLTGASESWQNETLKKIPLGFFAKPEDLDGAILFFSSNNASAYVTGACLTCDGGISFGR